MIAPTISTGRARTLLVFGEGDNAKAVLSTVVARSLDDGSPGGIRVTGPVKFEESVRAHLGEVVLPIVNRIVTALGLSSKGFEVSVVNLGAASAADVGSRITGFSADVPVFLAALSAALEMPVPQDLASTGHVASSDGDIAMVSAVPAKVAAAVADGSIRHFVHPDLERDGSLPALSPNETRRACEAILTAKDRIRTTAVGDVAELLQAVFGDDAVVLASLRQGFFALTVPEDTNPSPIVKAVHFLAGPNEARFWAVLERLLLNGMTDPAKELLLARVCYQNARRRYPGGFGGRLLQIVRSLPPATRRLRTSFPLVPMAECIRLSQFAAETDYEDVKLLYSAPFGERISQPAADRAAASASPSTAAATLECIVAKIDGQALANEVGLAIDTARAGYAMDSATVESAEEFNDTIAAYYVHLLRHIRSTPAAGNTDAARAEAISLVERAFVRRGGWRSAMAEGRDGMHGGMRFVLDVVTEQVKLEEQAKHVNYVFKEAIDPLDWDAKVTLVKTLMERLGAHLPPEVRSQPPERFAEHFEPIVQAYVKSLDKVNELLRAL